MELQNDKALAGAGQRKACIVPIHGFSGVDAVFLLVLDDLGTAIEECDVQKIGEFLNCHLAATRASGAKRGGDLDLGSLAHDDAPIDWHIGNFLRYVKENKVGPAEFEMMTDVAIGARAALGLAAFEPKDQDKGVAAPVMVSALDLGEMETRKFEGSEIALSGQRAQ